jgi:hypothetical protein
VETQLKQSVDELQVRQGLIQRSQYLEEGFKYRVIDVHPHVGGAWLGASKHVVQFVRVPEQVAHGNVHAGQVVPYNK